MNDKWTQAAYGASGITVWLGSLDWNKISMIGGLILGVLTFAVNAYFKYQNSKAYRDSLKNGVQADEPKE